MRKFTKIIAASIVFAGCSTTAFAGATDTAFTPKTTEVETSVRVQKTPIKRVTLENDRLPMASHVATESSRTVLFYDAAPTRTKTLKVTSAKTSTPNLFKH